MPDTEQPLISCIMPTYNRRPFVPHAIRYFLRQDYENKELIIIDDGTDSIADLVPDFPNIKYYRLPEKVSLGAKLNMACEYAGGELIANWDDDDWYSPRRLSYQENDLRSENLDIGGINNLLYFDLRTKKAFNYIYPPDQPKWLLGSSLFYRKRFWENNHYADINVGMDGIFVWKSPPQRVVAHTDPSFSVHMIHDQNVSPKKTESPWWYSYPVEKIRQIMDQDWMYYTKNGHPVEPNPEISGYPIKSVSNFAKPVLRNIYACLVHENEDCVIDMVRNLHYQDPDSVILLYNGGNHSGLLSNKIPYEKFGAVICPQPIQLRWGFLHPFAIQCMQFALEHFSFDTMTIVDSDQLAVRPGYPSYLTTRLQKIQGLGMLSSHSEKVDRENIQIHPAIQAFKEYDLWKPFLQKFDKGEDHFVHWTFWPSTVFTRDATKDLTRLFENDLQLQSILKQTRIWASEEIILPTLVKLLGYEIVANPCSYSYVRYKNVYTLRDIQYAMSRNDVYWIHPVERKYENPLRTHIRNQFNQYASEKIKTTAGDTEANNILLTKELINKINSIEGWLSENEADLLITMTRKICSESSTPPNIVEIGSYHGKSTVLFGTLMKAMSPGGKVYAVDPHDGKLGAMDQGLQSYPPSFESLKRNIANAGLTNEVEILRNQSTEVNLGITIFLLFIDGLHDYIHVAGDFWHFAKNLSPDAYVAFHDYADYFPGVKAFVHELLNKEDYQEIYLVGTLIVLQKKTKDPLSK